MQGLSRSNAEGPKPFPPRGIELRTNALPLFLTMKHVDTVVMHFFKSVSQLTVKTLIHRTFLCHREKFFYVCEELWRISLFC